jgi:hypothetical protein
MQKTCVVLQEKRFRAPAPPLLVATLAAVAACGPAAAGPAAGEAAGGTASAAAAAGLGADAAAAGAAAAGAAVAGAVMADAAAAALGDPVWRLGGRPLVLGGWGLQLPGI